MSWLRLHTKMRRSCISWHSRCSNCVEILGCKGCWHKIHSPVSVPRSCPQCRLDNWLYLPLLVPLIQMALEKSRQAKLELRRIYINVRLSFLQQWCLTPCGCFASMLALLLLQPLLDTQKQFRYLLEPELPFWAHVHTTGHVHTGLSCKVKGFDLAPQSTAWGKKYGDYVIFQMSQTQSLGFYGMELSCSPTQDRVSHSQINITNYSPCNAWCVLTSWLRALYEG